MKYSFKIQSGDLRQIKEQLSIISRLRQQLQQLNQQVRHEHDHAESVWRACLLEAKLDGSLAKSIDNIRLIDGMGNLVPNIRDDGIAEWTVPDPIVDKAKRESKSKKPKAGSKDSADAEEEKEDEKT